jgi:hypothetical protein
MPETFEGTHEVTQTQILRSAPKEGERVERLDMGVILSCLENQSKVVDDSVWIFGETKNGKRGWCLEKGLKQLPRQPKAVKGIKEILEENGLSEYISTFEQNKLTSADVLAELTENDYVQIGITVMGDRKKMMRLFSGKSAGAVTGYGAQTVPQNNTGAGGVQQQIIIQTNSQLPLKSMAAAVLLPLFFGCFGMFYASAGWGIFGLILYGGTAIITFVTLGLGALLYIPVGIFAIIATAVSVSNYNKRQLEKTNNAVNTPSPNITQ